MALVARGTCSHYHKARAAKELGASGVVIFSQNEVPVAMSCAAPDPCKDGLDIPVVMTTRSVGETLLEEMFNSSSGSLVMASLASQSEGPNMVGVLGHSGGLWYNSPIGPSQLADELRGMEYRRQLLQRQEDLAKASSSEVLRVDVFLSSTSRKRAERLPFTYYQWSNVSSFIFFLFANGGWLAGGILHRLKCAIRQSVSKY